MDRLGRLDGIFWNEIDHCFGKSKVKWKYFVLVYKITYGPEDSAAFQAVDETNVVWVGQNFIS